MSLLRQDKWISRPLRASNKRDNELKVILISNRTVLTVTGLIKVCQITFTWRRQNKSSQLWSFILFLSHMYASEIGFLSGLDMKLNFDLFNIWEDLTFYFIWRVSITGPRKCSSFFFLKFSKHVYIWWRILIANMWIKFLCHIRPVHRMCDYISGNPLVILPQNRPGTALFSNTTTIT